MLITEIKKRQKLSKSDFIKYQLMTYCFLNKINLSNAALDCLTLLVENNETNLNTFCRLGVDKKIFSSAQTVRNCLNDIEKFNLIVKRKITRNKKVVKINPDLNILYQGNLIIDFKFLLDNTL